MSDQDFFFDEDEATPAKGAKAPAKGTSKTPAKAPEKAPSKVVSAPAGSGDDVPFLDRQVTMTILFLSVAIALLLGIVAGYLLAPAPTSLPTVNTEATVPPASNSNPMGGATTTGTGSGAAPQLTPEQMNQGQLPAGHPSVGGGSSATSGTGK